MSSVESTLTRTGNSVSAAISADWRKTVGLNAGDKIKQEWTDGGALVITPVKSREANMDDLLDFFSFVETAPELSWPDDSRKADRAVIGERYV